MVFLYCFLRLNLKTRTLSPRPSPTMVAFTARARHQFAAVLESGLDGQFDFRADLAGQFFHADHVARSDAVLLSASFNYRVHANLDWEPEHTGCVGTTGVNHKFTTARR